MLTDQIRRIAPQYQPDADDLRWLESELNRAAEKALPKLIRKRFVETLKSAARNGPRSQAVVASPKPASSGVVGGSVATVATK